MRAQSTPTCRVAASNSCTTSSHRICICARSSLAACKQGVETRLTTALYSVTAAEGGVPVAPPPGQRIP